VNILLEELRINLYRAAQEHHRTGALYYAALERSAKETQKIAADEYKDSAEAYFGVLSVCEQHLLTIEKDEEMQQELKRIQTMKHSVETVLKYL
jgi:hypothetical protein